MQTFALDRAVRLITLNMSEHNDVLQMAEELQKHTPLCQS